MIPEAHVCHRTPQRLRVRIPSRKGDPAYFTSVREQFAHCGAVDYVEVNPLTASVLLFLSSGVEEVASFAQSKGLFKLSPVIHQPGTVSQMVFEGFRKANANIRSFTGGDLDLSELAFLALIGAGIYQVSIGNLAVPAWYTAFWYATNLLANERRDNTPESSCSQ